jgi:hypothetical protein
MINAIIMPGEINDQLSGGKDYILFIKNKCACDSIHGVTSTRLIVASLLT